MTGSLPTPARRGRNFAYLGAFIGGVVSVAANIAHSYVPPAAVVKAGQAAVDAWRPEPGAVVAAAFWPVALLVAVEIFARVEWPAGFRWLALRFVGLLPVAAVAAIVSYRHLSMLLGHYSEDPITVLIGPLGVDGLMIMATGALIALGQHSVDPGHDRTVTVVDPGHERVTDAVDPGHERTVTAVRPVAEPVAEPVADGSVDDRVDPGHGLVVDPGHEPISGRVFEQVNPDSDPGQRTLGNAALVAREHARIPDASHAEIARLTGLSASTVKRHRPGVTRVNGHAVPALVGPGGPS